MFFRNATLYRFPAEFAGLFPTPVADALEGLPAMLDEERLRPIGPLEMATYGFVSPLGRDSDELAVRVGNAVWITLGGEERILPGAVVNEALAQRIEELEEQQGRKPGGRMRRQMKDDLVQELMPKAFTKPVRLDAYLDLDRNFIAVDTTSRKKAEAMISHIRRAAGSFPALPLNAEVAPRAVLTGWISGDPLPGALDLGEECELHAADNEGAAVRCTRQDLESDEIARHLESGKQVTRLGLQMDDRVSFVFGEDLVLRKIRVLDGAVDQLDAADSDDIRAELNARFALMTGELGRLFDLLSPAFQISQADSCEAPAPARTSTRRSARARKDDGDGIDTVTISTPGREPVTMTYEQFKAAPGKMKELGRAAELLRASGKPSISGLQREMKIGYNAAARLMEGLEVMGVVSPPDSEGRRRLIQERPS